MKFHQDLLTERIISCIIKVHQTLGPGFLENIYKRALLIELKKNGLRTETEKEVSIRYDGIEVGRHRFDLVVEGQSIVELKAIEQLTGFHYAKTRSYLRASGLPVAILVNFSGEKADFRRIEGIRMGIGEMRRG